LGDAGGIEVAAEDGAELSAVGRDRSELPHQLLVRLVHIEPGLLLQRGPDPRPVLLIAEEPVDDRRRVPRTGLAREVGRAPARVAPAVIGPVAADAVDGARGRPALVPE